MKEDRLKNYQKINLIPHLDLSSLLIQIKNANNINE